jgi:serine protease
VTGHDPLYGYGIVDPAGSLRILLGAHGRLDAGVPDLDAGTLETDAGAPVPPPASCGCRATRTAPPALLALLGLVFFLRRR